jgi:hypothetical protein
MSTAEAAIAEKARSVPTGTFRHTVLQAAKRFKSSWVELGKLLVQVRNDAAYTDWGYESFEAYCMKELRIRKATADKLTRNFGFLEKHEPKAMQAEDIAETAPAFEVVEVLAQAEDRGQLSAQEYRSIRDSIWNPEKPVSEMRREFQERWPAPEGEAPSGGNNLKRLSALANRCAAELKAEKKVPRAIVERAEALAEDVAELWKASQADA